MTTHVVNSSEVRDAELAEMIDRLTVEMKAGQGPDIEGLLDKYPKHADELRRLLPALQIMADLSQSVEKKDGGCPNSSFILHPSSFPEGTLGDFRLIREVGRGGMGIVYEAEQISLSRRVALKVLPFAGTLDPRHLQRFRNEAQAAACLHHTNIVPVFFVGSERGVHYYAMQFIDGRTLADVIRDLRRQAGLDVGRDANATADYPSPDPSPKRGGEQDLLPSAPASGGEGMGVREDNCGAGVPPAIAAETAAPQLTTERSVLTRAHFRTVAQWGIQAAEALDHAHEQGIVHRDIKPANLLIDAGAHLWITDFGLAHCQADAALTMSGDLIGTLRYMSPEQALAKRIPIDHRTDIYSLGATLYELLALRPVIAGQDRSEILRQLTLEEPKPLRKWNKSIPPELETIVLKALEKDPNVRYATAQELADDLRRFTMDEPIKARRPTVMQRVGRWGRRHPGIMIATGLLAGLLIAGGWAWHRETTNAERAALAVAQESDQLRDADRLPEALQAAKRAVDLLPRWSGDAGPRRAMKERLDDLQLLNRLENIRLQPAISVGGKPLVKETQRVGNQMRQAFQEYGIDLFGDDEAAVADALQQRSIATQIAWALGELGIYAGPNFNERGRLVRLVDVLDTDPGRFTSRTLQASLGKDREALKRLAAEVETNLPPPTVLTRLALELKNVSCQADAERVLRIGVQRYPADFQINQELAWILFYKVPRPTAEALGFLRAALALRPMSASTWYNFGSALDAAGQHHEAAAALHRAITLDASYSPAYANLGLCLYRLGRHAQAQDIYRQALALDPNDATTHYNLGSLFWNVLNKPIEAVEEFRRAIALQPNLVEPHIGLGIALGRLGRHLEAEFSFRQAIKLKPNSREAHYPLGELLWQQGLYQESEAIARQVLAINPDDPVAQGSLGNALMDQGRPAEAELAFREVIRLQPEHAMVHCLLGRTLQLQGRFEDAVPFLGRGHELGSKQQGWTYPSRELLRETERMVELNSKLPALLSGETQPADVGEQLLLAQLCYHKALYEASARLFTKAFVADPKVGDGWDRYSAVCAAALAGSGVGADAANLSDIQRGRLRRESFNWLTDKITSLAKNADKPANRANFRKQLLRWQRDPALSGIRDAVALADLPELERTEWQKLWAEVAELLKRSEESKPPENPD